ncbi:hypothetical protein [Actinokineospora globicatena]|uniref:Uncharacterized protein n=1 Tax=Actinokineospora globicatena TaxID=103729 RepID=A0A9W6QPF6_9PSEU|nr:hypothetical protein [Actinokineospora globicatena]GLW92257.1 hypothetical protein Aglo03_30730 [Actinokineospora globicatena]
MPEEFEVDLDEVERLTRAVAALADGVRGDVAWKYGVDADQWPVGDPLREAVGVYLREPARGAGPVVRWAGRGRGEPLGHGSGLSGR